MGEVDLHNFADFDRLEYASEGRARLVWIPAEERKFRIGERPITRAVLLFEQVSKLSVTPRDPDMPVSEDRSLEDFEVVDLGAELFHLLFTFHGGMQIDITAASIHLSVEYGG
jgi:hypothetical protein